MKKLFCYNCGIELLPSRKAAKINPYPGHGQTREHIPAKCLFDGVHEQHAPNRITVNGCRNCNDKFSLDDEELRNVVGMLIDGPEGEPLTDNTYQSLKGKVEKEPSRAIYKKGKIESIEINNQMLFRAHEKHFRALFYHQYGQVLPEHYVVKVAYVQPNGKKGWEWEFFYDILKKFDWRHSGHPDIFKYVILPMKDTIKLQPIIPFEGNEIFIVGIFSYYNKYEVLIGATLKKEEQIDIDVSS